MNGPSRTWREAPDGGSGGNSVETLHALRREDGRLPLFLIVTADQGGHVLRVAVWDAEQYEAAVAGRDA